MRQFIFLSVFLAVVGPVVAQPVISVTPTSHDFGSVDVGKSSIQTFRVQNTGNDTLEASSSLLAGSHFSVSPSGSFQVPPGGFADLLVTFAPIRPGVQGDSLFIAHNATNQGSPIAVWLTGTGVPKPAISVSPTSYNFGTVPVRTFREATFTVRNTGSGQLAVHASIDQGALEYLIMTTTDAFSVPAGDSALVVVRYTPPSEAIHNGSLRIEHNGANAASPILVPLTGVGAQAVTIDPNEPNNTAIEATSVEVGFVSDSTEIWPTNDVDYFAFEGVYGEWIQIRCDIISSSTLNGKLWLYDASGNLLAENDNAGSNDRSEINDTLQTSGLYYIRVAFAGNPGIGFPNKPASKTSGEDPTGRYRLTIVRTGNDPLGTPSLVSPSDNVFDERVNPKLEWTTVDGSKIYDVVVSSTSSFDPGTIVYQSSRTDTAVVAAGLPAGTTLFWRVRAGNELGAGSFSPTRSFQTTFAPVVVNTIPDILLESGSSQVDLTPVFTDPEGGALQYRVVAVSELGIVNTQVQGAQLTVTQIGDAYVDVTVGATDPKGAETTTSFRVAAGAATDAEDEDVPAAEFGIGANYPNPFVGQTTIPISLTESAEVRLSLFDLRGREINVLAHGRMTAGTHAVDVSSDGLAAAVYFVRLEAGDRIAVRSIVVGP